MTVEEQVLDAEVVEESVATAPEASTEIVRRERRSEVLKPLDPDALVASFEDYQHLLQRILVDDDWQGRPNANGSFVKKKGWRKIATAFDLDVKVVPGMSRVERDENGNALRAEVWVCAVAPSGRSMDGDGYCSIDEPRFANASGRQKIENDLRATATTRAKNKAISDLVGMGAVSAEEVESRPDVQQGPSFGPVASDALVSSARKALGFLLDLQNPDDARVNDVLQLVSKDAGDYLPRSVLRGIVHTAAQAKKTRPEPATPEQEEQAQEAIDEFAAAFTDPVEAHHGD